MLPLPLTRTERRLLVVAEWPAYATALVAACYVLAAFLAVADTSDPWGAFALTAIGYTPVWIVAAVALAVEHRLRGGWVDTRIVPPAALGLALGAVGVIATTTYSRMSPLEPWFCASFLPIASAALALAALGLSIRRRWLRRDQTRWTPRPGS